MPKSDSSNPNGGPSFQGPRYRPNWPAAAVCFIAGTYLSAALLDYDPNQTSFHSTALVDQELGRRLGRQHRLGALLLDRRRHVAASRGPLLDVLRRDPQLKAPCRHAHHGDRDRHRLDVGPALHVREREVERPLPERMGRVGREDDLPAPARGRARAVRLRAPPRDDLLLRAALRGDEGHRLRDREDPDQLHGMEGGARGAQGGAHRGEGEEEGGEGEAAERAHRRRSPPRRGGPWGPPGRRRSSWPRRPTSRSPGRRSSGCPCPRRPSPRRSWRRRPRPRRRSPRRP